jgi:hypothetical protein
MSRIIVCMTNRSAGVRHRFIVMRQVKAFADRFGYSVHFLWGVTGAISFCRYEELFEPVDGVAVFNVPSSVFEPMATRAEVGSLVDYGGRRLSIFPRAPIPLPRPGGEDGSFFSWDLPGSGALSRMVPGGTPSLLARPSAGLQEEIDAYGRRNDVADRLGIRVRVTEVASQDRKPHRIKVELDRVLGSLFQIPWYTRVFLATDSEYIQQTLASHFIDSRFLPKRFDLRHVTGGYVHRQDREAMLTFLREVGCLCACKRVINIGGFLNDGSVRSRTMESPYEEAAFLHARRV